MFRRLKAAMVSEVEPRRRARFSLATLALTATITFPAAAQEPITFGQSYTIESEILGEARTVNVWVPPHADRDERAPYRTVYLIDGGTEQDWFHITGLMQLGALSWTFQPTIVVGIETDDRQNELTPLAQDPRYREEFPTSGDAVDFRAFITDEVQPFVANNFPVNGQSTVIGESLAGLFIVDTYLKEPATFDDYIAISPSLWWDDQRLGRDAPIFMAANDFEGTRLYLAYADEGGSMKAAIDLLSEAAVEAGIAVHYDDLSASQTHATIFHQAALNAVRLLYAEPPYDYGETPWYLVEGSERDAEE
ncbi:alpha/beta hydrolase [Henriciella pelagia]|uniref:Alpha/beta hydrolase n=1 Tax=Henriciella pelagia TaxID=1977912 RepID=A0ABQ1JY68_9PROT|nr:alpha/beta hydrolase-fold protein [Henriciella pelagia]GGB80461.1 hypothetical protein GCM10011503_31530 [Henriciella pelagia]